MVVVFNGKRYKKNSRNDKALKNLCFDVFQNYLELHQNLSYDEIRTIFSGMHCNNHAVVLSESDWLQKPDNTRNRYFSPINYNGMKLYFTTQWGNSGGDCDNINHMIHFAQKEHFNIKIIENTSINSFKHKENNIKNIILYGPPGVGKTHNYQHLISRIEEGEDETIIFDAITNNESSEAVSLNKEIYQKIDAEQRVEFITFHQSYSYEDFIEGFRPTEDGNIKLEDGIFKIIAQKALNNQKAAQQKHITFEEAYDILRTKYMENELEQLQTVRGINIIINDFSDKFLKVISEGAKNEQYIKKSDLELVAEGVLVEQVQKPADIKKLNVKKDTISLAGYYFPLAKQIALLMSENSSFEEEKNYYIVIDEINRGNISKIFGELITLIEEDKRSNYEVTLPYSKEKFIIPSNLYIIATMNSTDKSIATIDIALRRRFTFLKMRPNSNLVGNKEAQKLMLSLNEYIDKTLGADFLLGHSYFMGADIDLDFIKEYKIKPLLEEYFYSDENIEIDKLLKDLNDT
jgi:5-methylcytosine-specific restriction protein B